MRSHSYSFPQVQELLPPRRDERPPDGRRSQRDLVAASLLLRPVRQSPARYTGR
jgi:hypothetical protein